MREKDKLNHLQLKGKNFSWKYLFSLCLNVELNKLNFQAVICVGTFSEKYFWIIIKNVKNISWTLLEKTASIQNWNLCQKYFLNFPFSSPRSPQCHVRRKYSHRKISWFFQKNNNTHYYLESLWWKNYDLSVYFIKKKRIFLFR